MRRGDIRIAAARGASTGTPRPVVVIQDDRFDATASVTICPLTTSAVDAPLLRIALEPTEANGIRQPSQVMVDKSPPCRAPTWVTRWVGSAIPTWCVSTGRCWCFSAWRTEPRWPPRRYNAAKVETVRWRRRAPSVTGSPGATGGSGAPLWTTPHSKLLRPNGVRTMPSAMRSDDPGLAGATLPGVARPRGRHRVCLVGHPLHRCRSRPRR